MRNLLLDGINDTAFYKSGTLQVDLERIDCQIKSYKTIGLSNNGCHELDLREVVELIKEVAKPWRV